MQAKPTAASCLAVLGLDPKTPIGMAQAKEAYRRAAAEHHPDKHPGAGLDEIDQAAEAFKKARAAYERLCELHRQGVWPAAPERPFAFENFADAPRQKTSAKTASSSPPRNPARDAKSAQEPPAPSSAKSSDGLGRSASAPGQSTPGSRGFSRDELLASLLAMRKTLDKPSATEAYAPELATHRLAMRCALDGDADGLRHYALKTLVRGGEPLRHAHWPVACAAAAMASLRPEKAQSYALCLEKLPQSELLAQGPGGLSAMDWLRMEPITTSRPKQ